MGLFRRRKKCWKSIYSTRSEQDYHERCRMLEEADIDYRVWMDENEWSLVVLREFFEDPVNYRRRHSFFVRPQDYERGCRALGIDDDNKRGGIRAILF